MLEDELRYGDVIHPSSVETVKSNSETGGHFESLLMVTPAPLLSL